MEKLKSPLQSQVLKTVTTDTVVRKKEKASYHIPDSRPHTRQHRKTADTESTYWTVKPRS